MEGALSDDDGIDPLEAVDLAHSATSYPELHPAEELRYAHGSAAYPSFDDHLLKDSQSSEAEAEAEDASSELSEAGASAPQAASVASDSGRGLDRSIRSGSVFEVRVLVEDQNVKVADSMISQGYTLYTLEVFTTLSSYPSDTATVHRRFSDFDWLLSQLRAAFPGVILPPFPDKAIILTDHFSTEFVSLRLRDLKRFLDGVTRHPRLALSNDLKIFFTCDDKDFKEHRRASPAASASTSPATPAPASSESYTWRLLGKIMTHPAVEDDPYFTTAREKLDAIELVLTNMHTHAAALVQHHRRLATLQESFYSAVDSAVVLEAGDYLDSLRYFRSASLEVMQPANEFADALQQFVEDLVEAVRMVGSAKSSLAARLRLQEDYQTTVRSLEAAGKALEKSRSSPSFPKQEKAVADLQRKHDDLKSRYESVSVVLRQELDDYFVNRPFLFKRSITQYAKSNLDHAVQSANLWRDQLNHLQE